MSVSCKCEFTLAEKLINVKIRNIHRFSSFHFIKRHLPEGKVDEPFVCKSKEAWLPAKDMRGYSLRYEKVRNSSEPIPAIR